MKLKKKYEYDYWIREGSMIDDARLYRIRKGAIFAKFIIPSLVDTWVKSVKTLEIIYSISRPISKEEILKRYPSLSSNL